MENHLIKESDDAEIGEPNVDNINNSVQISNSNQIDSDELLAKIYNENINKINTLTNLLQIVEYSAVLSFLFFLILLAIKLSPHGNFSFAFLLIPSIITICSVAIALNAILSLKNIIDITEKKESRASTAFSYLLLNITAFSFIIFDILLMLYLQNAISSKLNIIFIPLYIALILILSYAIFIAPAFFYGGLYMEIFTLFIYIISSILFATLLGIKSEKEIKFVYIFIPYYFAVGLHICFIAAKAAMRPKEETRSRILNGIALILVLISGMLIQVKKDNIIENKAHYIEVILYIVSFITLSTDMIINKYQEEEDMEIKTE